MLVFKTIACICVIISLVAGHTTQRPGGYGNPYEAQQDDNAGSPFFDMASAFLQETLTNQNSGGGGGGGGLGGIASLIGTFMQPEGGASKSDNGAGAILSGIGSIISSMNSGGGGGNSGGSGGGGFDPALIGNVIQLFASVNSASNTNNNNNRNKRSDEQSSPIMDTVLSLATTFLASQNQVQHGHERRETRQTETAGGDGLMALLPMVMQAFNSFSGPEGQKTQQKHKEHAWVLPPFLEKIHVLWDHFQQSELAQVLWEKSGIHTVFKGFVGRDDKLNYEKLFESLENQSFRRKWLKKATLYLADWANYIANPEVYTRYFHTGQMMLNGFLQSQGYPKQTHVDTTRPSETVSNLIDHIAKKHLNIKIQSLIYVKPTINYIKDLLKLGQARGLLQNFNSTEISDKLTDTLNLEVIEPVLRVYRAYRHAIETPHCDKYILCEVNSHDSRENFGLAKFKSGITKFGSMAAAWFISTENGTPFWTLFGVINEPYNCQTRFPVDCTGFHDNEAKVTTEYIHNEL